MELNQLATRSNANWTKWWWDQQAIGLISHRPAGDWDLLAYELHFMWNLNGFRPGGNGPSEIEPISDRSFHNVECAKSKEITKRALNLCSTEFSSCFLTRIPEYILTVKKPLFPIINYTTTDLPFQMKLKHTTKPWQHIFFDWFKGLGIWHLAWIKGWLFNVFFFLLKRNRNMFQFWC